MFDTQKQSPQEQLSPAGAQRLTLLQNLKTGQGPGLLYYQTRDSPGGFPARPPGQTILSRLCALLVCHTQPRSRSVSRCSHLHLGIDASPWRAENLLPVSVPVPAAITGSYTEKVFRNVWNVAAAIQERSHLSPNLLQMHFSSFLIYAFIR